MKDSGFRVKCSGFRAECSGFRVKCSGFRVKGQVEGSGFRVMRVQGFRFRVED